MPDKVLIYGQRVSAGGKEGIIISMADKMKVKFDDGSFAFFEERQVNPVVNDSRLKGVQDGTVMQHPTATGEDPLAQSSKKVGGGMGETNTVLGKSVGNDKLEAIEMAKKVHLKEEEAEDMKAKKEAEDESEEESEAEVKKKPTRMVGGKLVKEDESEDEDVHKPTMRKEDEDESEDEAAKKKTWNPADADDEALEDDEEDDESEGKSKKRKKAVKGTGSSLSPSESGARASSGEGTITPGYSTPSKGQNVLVPPSDVNGKRTQETPMGKSFSPDLLKSPLFVGISGQIDDMRKALDVKFEAAYKSYNDRLDNMKKELEKTEEVLKKFYSQSFMKAYGDDVPPEGTQLFSIEKQIAMGKIRTR